MALARNALMFLALGLAACGSDKKNDDKDTSTATKYTFTADINPIIKNSCGGTECHGKGASTITNKVFEDNEAGFKAEGSTLKTRLNADKSDALYMPQDKRAFSDADKQKLIDFMNQ